MHALVPDIKQNIEVHLKIKLIFLFANHNIFFAYLMNLRMNYIIFEEL